MYIKQDYTYEKSLSRLARLKPSPHEVQNDYAFHLPGITLSPPPPIHKGAQPAQNYNLNNKERLHIVEHTARTISQPLVPNTAIHHKPQNVVPKILENEANDVDDSQRLRQLFPPRQTNLPHNY